ncbi:MAG: hypothetical protein ACT4O1_02260 [Gemmatimonadota bacterium]
MRQPVRASVALVLLLPQLTGCYQYVPASSSAMPTGTNVSVAITDAGRSALAERVGPGVRRIGGLIQASTDTMVVLSVTSVEYIDLNTPVRWAGEQLMLRREHTADVRERKLSRGRSWVAAGLVAVAAIAAATLGIAGFGSEGGSDRPGDGTGDQ